MVSTAMTLREDFKAYLKQGGYRSFFGCVFTMVVAANLGYLLAQVAGHFPMDISVIVKVLKDPFAIASAWIIVASTGVFDFMRFRLIGKADSSVLACDSFLRLRRVPESYRSFFGYDTVLLAYKARLVAIPIFGVAAARVFLSHWK